MMTVVTAAVDLTGPQLRLLRFFADRCSEPRTVRSGTYAALTQQGLIQMQADSPRYKITEFGQRVVAKLEQDPSPGSRPILVQGGRNARGQRKSG